MNQQASTTAGIGCIDPSTLSPEAQSRSRQGHGSSWTRRIIGGVAFAGLAFSLLASGKAEAVSFTFEKIVDTNTSIPGGPGTFQSFGSGVSLDNGNVAFEGTNGLPGEQGFRRGIYTNIAGRLNVVADTDTPIPDGTGNFKGFGEVFGSPSLDNGNVAFIGFDEFNTEEGGYNQEGIYTDIGGRLNVVADKNNPIFAGNEYNLFNRPSLDDGNVAFGTTDQDYPEPPDKGGVYTNINGKLNVVADLNTPIPGSTDDFLGFFAPSLGDGNVAFTGGLIAPIEGQFAAGGVYTNIGGKLNVVADLNTSVPGGTGVLDGTGTFKDTPYFGAPSLNGGDVAFWGGGSFDIFNGVLGGGIYTSIDGELNVVANRNTPVPDGIGTFEFINSPSLDNGKVVFSGGTFVEEEVGPSLIIEQKGIYTNITGDLAEVIAIGDRLDGKEVNSITFGPEGLSGNQIAFSAGFTNGSQGIYIATVPEPASVLGTLAFGAFGTSWMLKHKLKQQKLVSRIKRVD